MWKLVLTVLAAVLAVGLGSLVGGVRDVDVNDEEARRVLSYAVGQHNRFSNDMYLSQVAEVVKVQKQLVAGIKYIITVKMGRTPCRKDGVTEQCAVHEDPTQARAYQCTFTVWSRPWLDEIKVLDEKC